MGSPVMRCGRGWGRKPFDVFARANDNPPMGFIDVSGVTYALNDGHQLLDGATFRVGEGDKVALIGANGTGKTTLLRMITGELKPDKGVINHSGGMGVMRQLIGMREGEQTLSQLALSLTSPRLEALGQQFIDAEAALHRIEKRGKFSNQAEKAQLNYAQAMADWVESGGYDFDVRCDVVSVQLLHTPWEEAKTRPLNTLSGGEQKRFALELLLQGPDEVLVLDEPDNFLDVPAKRDLERRLQETDKSILFVSHDREVLANAATTIVTLEVGETWTHGGGFATWHQARVDRH